MTVGRPESTAEEHELSCVQFSRTVYRQQTGTVRRERRRQCHPGTQDVDSASGLRIIERLPLECMQTHMFTITRTRIPVCLLVLASR